MNINQLEALEKRAKEFLDKSTALNHTKFVQSANPSAILALISDNKSRRNMLDMVINSVAAALERAGVTSVDDPGEAIDVLVADKDAEIARLRESGQWQPVETAPKDGSMFLGWVSAERWNQADGEGSGIGYDVSEVDFCRWNEMPTGGFYENMMGQIGDAQDISLWMPLPPPPPRND